MKISKDLKMTLEQIEEQIQLEMRGVSDGFDMAYIEGMLFVKKKLDSNGFLDGGIDENFFEGIKSALAIYYGEEVNT